MKLCLNLSLTLLRAQKDLDDKDLLWATVAIYYAEYYSLYAFLQGIGIKCENHAYSILAAGLLLGEDKTRIINEHKSKRLDAQYYMKTDREEQVRTMLNQAKLFVAIFDEIVSKLSQKSIQDYRKNFQKLM